MAQQEELDEMRLLVVEMQDKHNAEMAIMKEKLDQSINNEKKLKRLNEESHNLLILNSINKL